MSHTGATEILPNLWIGGIKTSQSKEWLESHIDIVINCTKDIDFSSDITQNIRIPVDDNLELPELTRLYTFFEKTAHFIDQQLRQGKRILIHCMAGRQRSASILCAYLMTFLDLPLSKASALLRMKRNVIFHPACNFQPALLKYQYYLADKKKTADM